MESRNFVVMTGCIVGDPVFNRAGLQLSVSFVIVRGQPTGFSAGAPGVAEYFECQVSGAMVKDLHGKIGQKTYVFVAGTLRSHRAPDGKGGWAYQVWIQAEHVGVLPGAPGP